MESALRDEKKGRKGKSLSQPCAFFHFSKIHSSVLKARNRDFSARLPVSLVLHTHSSCQSWLKLCHDSMDLHTCLPVCHPPLFSNVHTHTRTLFFLDLLLDLFVFLWLTILPLTPGLLNGSDKACKKTSGIFQDDQGTGEGEIAKYILSGKHV